MKKWAYITIKKYVTTFKQPIIEQNQPNLNQTMQHHIQFRCNICLPEYINKRINKQDYYERNPINIYYRTNRLLPK